MTVPCLEPRRPDPMPVEPESDPFSNPVGPFPASPNTRRSRAECRRSRKGIARCF